jgi:hypothetical protein
MRGGRGGGSGGGTGGQRTYLERSSVIDLTASPYNFRPATTLAEFAAAPDDYDIYPAVKQAMARMVAVAAISEGWRGGEILLPSGYMRSSHPVVPENGNITFRGCGEYSTYVQGKFAAGCVFDLENPNTYEWGEPIVTGEDYSIEFDGTDDHCINLTLDSAQFHFDGATKPNFCVEFFLELTSHDPVNGGRIISSGGTIGSALHTHADSLTVHITPVADPMVQMLVRLSSGGTTGATSGILSTGVRYHVAFQLTTSGGNTTVDCYIDGVLAGTNTAAGTWVQKWDEIVTIGPGSYVPMYGTYYQPAHFKMSSVRMYFNQVRMAPFTAPTTALPWLDGYQGMLISMAEVTDDDDLDQYGVELADPSFVRVKVGGGTGGLGYVRMRRAGAPVNYVPNTIVRDMTISTNGGSGDEGPNGQGGTCIYGRGVGQSTFENLRVEGHNGIIVGNQSYNTRLSGIEIRSSLWGLLTFGASGLLTVDTVFAYEGKFPLCIIGSGVFSNIIIDPGEAVVPAIFYQELGNEGPFTINGLVIGSEAETEHALREYEVWFGGQGQFVVNGLHIRQIFARSTCLLVDHNIGGLELNGFSYTTDHSETDDVKLITFMGGDGTPADRPADGEVPVELRQFKHTEAAGSIDLVTSNDPGHCRYSDRDAHPGIYQGEATIADAAVSSTVTFESTIDGVTVAAPLANATYKVRMMTTARSGANAVSSQVAHASARATTGFLMAVRQAPGAGTSVTIGWEVVGYEGVE